MKVAIGQDSHQFDFENNQNKKLVLAGVVFEGEPPMLANSDGDVVLHAITNAISGITTKNILGEVTGSLLKEGITDSKVYLQEAMKYLDEEIVHLSISMECKVPKITPKIDEMRKKLAELLHIKEQAIGITATSGEELTEFGRGKGIQVLACITTQEKGCTGSP